MKEFQVTLDTIRRELGERMAHHLTDCCGGRRVQIPNRRDKSGTLRVLGVKAARILCERFGGCVIDVPTGNEYRRREIARLREQGENPVAIAHRLGCTQRYVCDVLAEQDYRAAHSWDE